MVGDISGETPIVRAIFEEITQGHSGVRETMDENRLQQTFHIMDCVTGSGNTEMKQKYR